MRPTQLSNHRAGISLIESLVALSLLGLILTLTVPLLHRVNVARHHSEQRRIAAIELSNLMEELAARPADQLTNDELQKLVLSGYAQQALPEAKLHAVAQPDAEIAELIQVRLRVDWPSPTGSSVEPTQLVAWLGPHPSKPNK